MRKAGILFTGLVFLALPMAANAAYLILRIDVATQVDLRKVEAAHVECYVNTLHHAVVGIGWTQIPFNDDGSFYGLLEIPVEPTFGVGGDADMLANADNFNCIYVVKKHGEHNSHTPLRDESDIPDGLESYLGRGGRPFRPTATGRVEW